MEMGDTGSKNKIQADALIEAQKSTAVRNCKRQQIVIVDLAGTQEPTGR